MTTSRDAGDHLLRILDELDALITQARSMPMSASAIVNRDEARGLIDRARQAVPRAVHHAEEIVADADAVLARGREEAERLIVHAQEEAERLVAGENIVRAAHERADEIVADAEQRAAQLRHGADDYSDRTLATLEIEIERVAAQIRSGRSILATRLDAARAERGGTDHATSSANTTGTARDPQGRSPDWPLDSVIGR